jgi:uncharacterized protein (DUF1015 family)
MPRFEPFAAVRYDPEQVPLADVVAPPYDVIGPEERARLEARSPYNVVHVDLARDEDRRNRYDAARCRLDEWLENGILLADDAPAFYLYRMGWHDDAGRPRQTSGVLGALELDAAGAGTVLPHERTMAKPLDDRLRLLRACRANVSPIWGLSLAGIDAPSGTERGAGSAAGPRAGAAAAPSLAGLTEPSGPPLARLTDDDGVHHRMWRIDAPATVEAISAAVGSAPVVIADGHHRYETALAYRAERRATAGGVPGPYDFMLAYVVALAQDEIDVHPIHRLLADLPDAFPIVEAFAASFAVEDAGAPSDALAARMDQAGALGLVVRDRAYLLHPQTRTGTAGVIDPTDSERLERVLGSLPAHAVGYDPDLAHALAVVDKGEAQVAVLLRPPTVAQIASAAHARRRLPQKTTFFRPKPRTGLVFRFLER